MLRGLYSAASGMYSLERRQEALANNLANAQTPGFKKDDTVLRAFPNLLINRIRDFNENGAGAQQLSGQSVPIGVLSNGVYTQERIPSFQQGSFVQSGMRLDVAIDDQAIPMENVNGRVVKPTAFFAIQLPDGGVGYTRNGKFDLDANGNLVTSDGYRVLGANHQPIQLVNNSKEDVQITADGQIMVNSENTIQNVGQIGIAVVQNPYELRRLGGNVYQSDQEVPFIQDGGGTNPGVNLHQGYYEGSNVDAGQTMSDMMMTVRGYEANQKVISVYEQSIQQLYSVGKLNG
ncbi:flagellar hook-basal body protein [Bacillus sp. S3]|uniref:flagellar hook-basal body protein n=1 Tax=Bacillus sp. S3 TaxID=486398 RepID=UPI0011886D0C|nr:flagellar hook-basal body protein [Bacillus sp. S3]QCJ42374.1 flagellar hook-basal body protein [Bacillus sp. S3]